MINNAQIASTTTTQIFLSNGQNAVTTIIFCNVTNDTTANLDVWVVPFGQNASLNNQIMKSVTLPPTETFVLDSERLILEDNDAIYAQADLGNGVIVATVSSVNVG